jgi:uncharacterized protein
MPDFDGEQPGEKAGGVAQTSWRVAAGVLATVVGIVLVASVAGSLANAAYNSWSGIFEPVALPPGAFQDGIAAGLAVFLTTFQAAVLTLTFVASRFFDDNSRRLLGFAGPMVGPAAVLRAIAVLLALSMLFAAAVYTIDRNALIRDVAVFLDMLRSANWWMIALAAVIGAPLAEEFLFRGLMYGVLRDTPVGGAGAALVTSVVWASVHAQYSVYGLVAIFLIGLYLCYLREKTGSLWPPILCHGAYNGAIVATLVLAPDRVLSLVQV